MNDLRNYINDTMIVHVKIKRIVRGASRMARVETDRGGESQTLGFLHCHSENLAYSRLALLLAGKMAGFW